MSLSSIEKIDSLFAYLYNKGSEYTILQEIKKEHFKDDTIKNDIEGMLIKLERDGFVDTGWHKRDVQFGIRAQKVYKLSYEGRLLFESSSQNKPYRGLNRKDKKRQIWMAAKIIAAILNAVIIILIAFFALKAQREANKIDKTIDKTKVDTTPIRK
jgi:DNA-binding PadR family transcriptional regulator